jgi:hypothetical protein
MTGYRKRMSRYSIPIVALLITALSAPVAAGHERGASTFEGSCHFAGTVSFEPPLTDEAQPARGSARAGGPCTGTFTDRRGRSHELDGDRVTYVAANRGSMSCGGGVAEGGGYLGFGSRRLRFTLTEVRGTGAAELFIEGARGGVAQGVASVSQEEDPAEIAQKCLGSGLPGARIVIDLATLGISG